MDLYNLFINFIFEFKFYFWRLKTKINIINLVSKEIILKIFNETKKKLKEGYGIFGNSLFKIKDIEK